MRFSHSFLKKIGKGREKKYSDKNKKYRRCVWCVTGTCYWYLVLVVSFYIFCLNWTCDDIFILCVSDVIQYTNKRPRRLTVLGMAPQRVCKEEKRSTTLQSTSFSRHVAVNKKTTCQHSWQQQRFHAMVGECGGIAVRNTGSQSGAAQDPVGRSYGAPCFGRGYYVQNWVQVHHKLHDPNVARYSSNGRLVLQRSAGRCSEPDSVLNV
jgi:hypothetical protein